MTKEELDKYIEFLAKWFEEHKGMSDVYPPRYEVWAGIELPDDKLEFVSYTGKWPNLCRGVLTVKCGEKVFKLDGVLESGGSCGFTRRGNSHITHGRWFIRENNLPKELLSRSEELEDLVNDNVEQGCCGGCL